MEIYQILLEILNKPDAPKFYRELRNYYQNNNLTHEASAISYLIENKFEKKDVDFNNSHNNKEQ